MSDEEWVHGGPERADRPHDSDRRLHAAFGSEVEALEIGPSPIGAVLRDGVGLRRRRRAVWSGGVAGLLVLPVAAAVAFGGGTGASRQDAADRGKPTMPTTPTTAVTTNETATETANETATSATPTTTDTDPAEPTKPSLTKPSPEPPNPVDTIDVVGSGTFEGKPWRLVRDRFAAPAGTPGFGPQHSPFASADKNGLGRCEFLGLQLGDAPAGTKPDFQGGGGCESGADLRTVPGGINDSDSAGLFPQSGPPADGVMLSGVLDPTKVATFDILLDGVTKIDPTPVFQRPGDPMGYYAGVVPVPGVRSIDQHTLVVEFRDAHGKVVGRYSPTQPPLPTK